MAANAYVLSNVEPARTQEVVELEAGTVEDLTEIMRHRIRPINGVTNTVTCLWFTNI